MRTLTDWFFLSLSTLTGGAVTSVLGYIWGDQVELLKYLLPYGSVVAIFGLAGALFIGIELLNRRFP